MSTGGGYINKIMVDSRFKTPSSISSTNFTIELNENIQLPDRTGCIVTDVVVPRTWYAVNSTNNRLYFRITKTNSERHDYIATLNTQNYTLFNMATGLIAAINEASGADYFNATPDANTGKIKLSIKDNTVQSFSIFTDADLRTRCNQTWRGPYYNNTNLLSINSVLRNDDQQPLQLHTTSTPFYTGVVDLIGIHTIYITSSSLTTYNNIGSRGERNILKKVLCSVGFGELILENTFLDKDYTDVSNRPLKTLDFRVVDVYGNDVDLNGGHVSFSLLFIDI
jgi:hypothetical protein